MERTIDDKPAFLIKYNISESKFEESGISWTELQEIYSDYLNFIPELEPVAEYVASILRKEDHVHSVRQRIKDPEHLIAKIIRKKLSNPELEYTISNYKNKVTDLSGIRALHLFKEECKFIDDFVNNRWELNETPKANIRDGDDPKLLEQFKEKDYEIVNHEYGYRSLHYIIKTRPYKADVMVELQVRTIFEEGWSEIDHLIRYPHNMDDEMLRYFLVMFNRLAGNADEMGSYVLYLRNTLKRIEELHANEIANKDDAIHQLEEKISALKIDEKEKETLKETIEDLRNQLHKDKPRGILLGSVTEENAWLTTNKSKIEFATPIGVSHLPQNHISNLSYIVSTNPKGS